MGIILGSIGGHFRTHLRIMLVIMLGRRRGNPSTGSSDPGRKKRRAKEHGDPARLGNRQPQVQAHSLPVFITDRLTLKSCTCVQPKDAAKGAPVPVAVKQETPPSKKASTTTRRAPMVPPRPAALDLLQQHQALQQQIRDHNEAVLRAQKAAAAAGKGGKRWLRSRSQSRT